MYYSKLKFIFILFLTSNSWSAILRDYCKTNGDAVQCRLLELFQIRTSECNPSMDICRWRDSDDTPLCDPFTKKGCHMHDVVDPKIASCQLATQSHGLKPGYINDQNLRCVPEVISSINIFYTRISAVSSGEAKCVPVKYGMEFVCGEKGTRCVCEPSHIDHVRYYLHGKQQGYFLDRMSQNQCRCQWFVDYCAIENICSSDASSCVTLDSRVQCKGGSVNQCYANPALCVDENAYCVELDDRGNSWQINHEVKGNGFACIDKEMFAVLTRMSTYCNFDVTNHTVIGHNVKRPNAGLDQCCYQQLVCAQQHKDIGGYLFRERPCYCNTEFKKCLLKQTATFSFKEPAKAIISILENIKLCQLDDTGTCNPLKPDSCKKGDLIDKSIAHCKVNCKTGPLLPIQFRSCRIRQCKPIFSSKDKRVIDVTSHRESSRCDAVKDLPILCGMHHTRCVCDSHPTVKIFTDKCRCQYWPS